MAKYKLTATGVRWGNRHIPNDEDNLDWQEYQEWLAEGNTPDPKDPPPPAPPSRAHPDATGNAVPELRDDLNNLIAKLRTLGVLE
jgi:hypothetical protein